MIRYLAMVQTSNLNLFPVKGGVSDHYSPRMIITQEQLNYDRDCKVEFGSYVQVNHEPKPTNTLEARTIDAIYLRPAPDAQNGHEVMDLNSG